MYPKAARAAARDNTRKNFGEIWSRGAELCKQTDKYCNTLCSLLLGPQ